MNTDLSVLIAQDLSLSLGGNSILSDISLKIHKGQISVIAGPNGSGKSTLLRALSRILRPSQGCVLLEGVDIHLLPTKEVAKKLSLLPQSQEIPESLSVHDLVWLGRSPYKKMFHQFKKTDCDAVENALSLTGVKELESRSLNCLSGGQRQRVWLAFALAQEAQVLLLDEPTTYLDPYYQYEILNLLRDLNKKSNLTILMVLHDLNLASAYSDFIFLLKEGKVFAQGRPEDVLDQKTLGALFQLKVEKIKLQGENRARFFFGCH